jgi:O-antigen/teichoic acid export membrane protein
MADELNIPMPAPGIIQRANTLVRGRLTPVFYAGSSVMTQMAQLVSGVVIIKWIAPEELGLWQSVRMAQVYAFLLLLGINNGFARELPFFLGKGDESFANRLAGTAYFCATMANIVVLACGIVCAFFFAHHGVHVVAAIVAITLVIMLTFYQHILQLTFRSKDSFKKLTNIQLTEAALSIVTVPVVYFFGFYGMLGRAVLMTAIICSLLFLNRPMRVKLKMDWQAFKTLLKTGLPIFGLDYFKNSCSTLDRWVLLDIGGVKTVGIYALAGMVTQTLGSLPGALSTYTYPRMSFKYGQSGDPRDLWRFGIRFELVSMGITIAAAICAYIAMPYCVPIFAPKYLEGISAAKIMLISASIGSATIIVDALWSMKIWRLMVGVQIANAILFAMAPLLGVFFLGKSVEAVAWGAVVGSILRSLVALSVTYYGTHRKSPPK